MKNPNPDAYREPETPTTKTIKKSAIGWLVPTVLTIIGLGFVAMVKLQARDMLKDYITKDEASAVHAAYDKRLNEYQSEIILLKDKLDSMDRKLDHLQWSYDQDRGKPLLSPKQKDQP